LGDVSLNTALGESNLSWRWPDREGKLMSMPIEVVLSHPEQQCRLSDQKQSIVFLYGSTRRGQAREESAQEKRLQTCHLC